jgi:hypothetical protein
MLIDLLQRLDAGGFGIEDYHYIGLGSFYFVDFVLLHRYFGLRKLTSVEHDHSIRRRVKFNKPFGLIQTHFEAVAETIARITGDERYILWLDYDDFVTKDCTGDLAQFYPLGDRGL